MSIGRTPPGVRELKLLKQVRRICVLRRRTPPGVRELKLDFTKLPTPQL